MTDAWEISSLYRPVGVLPASLFWAPPRVLPLEVRAIATPTFRCSAGWHPDKLPQHAITVRYDSNGPVISVSGIRWKPGPLTLRNTPNLYVGIDIDGKPAHRSSAKRAWEGKWNDLAPISAESPSSRLILQVFNKRSFKDDKCLAKAELEIGVLLDKCSTQKDFHVKLDHVEENVTDLSKPELVVCMTAIGHAQAGAIALANATQDSATLERGLAVKLVDLGAEHPDLASVLGTLIARVDIIVQMGAEIAKIHPYSNAAWKVLTLVYEAVKKQDEKDEKVIQLVQAMSDAYSFVEDMDSLPGKIKRLEDTISALVKQTEECALFIREYTGHGFCGRLLTELWSGHGEKIDDFTAAFGQLQKALDTGLGLYTAFVSTKTQEMVKGLGENFSPTSFPREVLTALSAI
ncbi:hypothetical protein FB451DRAFT_1560182 [Mycena latifolia]|nr:hypothetical protein FB451DRAFT_1560182 [Mycena latifolia]